jgi:hypothetical protein
MSRHHLHITSVFELRRVEERVEWRVEFPVVDGAVAECDAAEDGVVELSFGGVAVGGLAVGCDACGECEDVAPLVEILVEAVESLLGTVGLTSDAFLLRLE